MNPSDQSKGAKKKRPHHNHVTLKYPKQQFQPADLLDFIELPVFTKRWASLELNDENDLCALQLAIMLHPRAGNVIQGTRGLRKMRFAPSRWKCGKSDAARVLYVIFEGFGICILALVYDKSEVEDISDAVKKYLNKLIAEIEKEIRRRKTIR